MVNKIHNEWLLQFIWQLSCILSFSSFNLYYLYYLLLSGKLKDCEVPLPWPTIPLKEGLQFLVKMGYRLLCLPVSLTSSISTSSSSTLCDSLLSDSCYSSISPTMHKGLSSASTSILLTCSGSWHSTTNSLCFALLFFLFLFTPPMLLLGGNFTHRSCSFLGLPQWLACFLGLI